jgi:hypothetical protein
VYQEWGSSLIFLYFLPKKHSSQPFNLTISYSPLIPTIRESFISTFIAIIDAQLLLPPLPPLRQSILSFSLTGRVGAARPVPAILVQESLLIKIMKYRP